MIDDFFKSRVKENAVNLSGGGRFAEMRQKAIFIEQLWAGIDNVDKTEEIGSGKGVIFEAGAKKVFDLGTRRLIVF